MTAHTPIIVSFAENIAWVEIDNPPVNATSTAVRAGLVAAVEEVEASDAQVAILICAGKTFIAGGDMSEFDAPPVEPHLPEFLTLIENSRVPWIAAMHGNVLGGGFEIAMGCAWRIALAGTRFGLPEVNVGLIPGAGGTQRLPRLVPMPLAIEMACRGSLQSATAMFEAGAIDKIIDGDLRAAALDFAANLPSRPTGVSERPTHLLNPNELEKERHKLRARARGQQSPLHNLDALQWAALPFSEGQQKERALHLDLRNSAESRALRHAFFAEREVAKPALIAGVSPKPLEKIAIVGGGLMGTGIATAALNAGYTVTIIERDAQAAEAAANRVTSNLDGALKRGKITDTQRSERQNALTVADNFDAAEGHDLVVEAVFEDLAVKKGVFATLAQIVSPTTLLATNTSYLNPVDIFDGTPNPERCFGLHYFSPAHIMKLVEVVHLPLSNPETIATGFSLAKKMRKVGVLSGVCDGFIGNRMLAAYRRSAEYMLADGALPDQIDSALRAFGYAMGPFEVQDMSGLQIAWANRKANAASRDPNQRYIPIADRLCEADRLGQRSGGGWYDYHEGDRSPHRSPLVEDLIAAYSQEVGIKRRAFSDDEIVGRSLAVLANEGLMIVEEGIAENAAAVDMVQLHGYGFPRWRGGPMRYAEEIGFDDTAEFMAKVSNDSPQSWTIAKNLRR